MDVFLSVLVSRLDVVFCIAVNVFGLFMFAMHIVFMSIFYELLPCMHVTLVIAMICLPVIELIIYNACIQVINC